MSYNRKNHLLRVIDITTIYQEYHDKGLNNREIWRRYIYPIYKISERSLYNYLNLPAMRDLKQIEEHEAQQGVLF